jgi:hypothetical protein
MRSGAAANILRIGNRIFSYELPGNYILDSLGHSSYILSRN